MGLTVQQKKALAAAIKAAPVALSSSNPLVTAAEQPIEESAGVIQAKTGFGSNGFKMGTDATEVTKSLTSDIPTGSTVLLHGEGSNGGTTITNSIAGITATARGATTTSTADKVFGSSSILMDADGSGGDDVSLSASPITLGSYTAAFTISFRIKFVTINSGDLFTFNGNNSGIGAVTCFYTGGNLYIYRYSSAGTRERRSVAFSPGTSAWKAMEISFDGSGTPRLYIDGTAQTLTDIGSQAASITNTGSFIGVTDNWGAASKYYMDEIVVVDGQALHTGASYSLPTTAFGNYVSADLVTSGSLSFAPASLKMTINGTERDATVPSDLAIMDAAATMDYSFDASGGDGTTGYTGSPVSITNFAAIAASTFSTKSHVFLKPAPIGSDAFTDVSLTTQSTATVMTKTDGFQVVLNSVPVIDLQDDGDIIAADILADDISMTGNLVCSGEGSFSGNISVGASGEFQTFRATTSTSDETPATIATIAVGEDAAIAIHAIITGNEASSANKNKYVLEGMFYRNGSGDVTQLGDIVSLDTNEGDTVWNATFSANTGTQAVDVLVSGEAGTTVAWKCFGYYTEG